MLGYGWAGVRSGWARLGWGWGWVCGVLLGWSAAGWTGVGELGLAGAGVGWGGLGGLRWTGLVWAGMGWQIVKDPSWVSLAGLGWGVVWQKLGWDRAPGARIHSPLASPRAPSLFHMVHAELTRDDQITLHAQRGAHAKKSHVYGNIIRVYLDNVEGC